MKLELSNSLLTKEYSIIVKILIPPKFSKELNDKEMSFKKVLNYNIPSVLATRKYEIQLECDSNIKS